MKMELETSHISLHITRKIELEDKTYPIIYKHVNP